MSNQPYAPPPSYNAATSGGGYSSYPAGPQAGAYDPPPQASPAGYGYGEEPKPQYGWGGGTGNTTSLNTDTDETHIEPSFNTGSFSDKAIRRGFIRKVYLILFTQLMVTFAFVCLFSFIQPIKDWVRYTPGGPICYYVSYAVFLVVYFALVCVPSVRRQTPGNFIALGIFTLAFSYMVGMISSFYDTNSVLVAAGITALVCLSLTLFALQTKIDFTMCSGLLFVLVMVLIFFGFSCMIVYITVGYNRILDCVWGGLAALVFSLFLIYDTQMIVGGRKHELDPEEYVYGALQLYIDVVYLFLIILSLFGKNN